MTKYTITVSKNSIDSGTSIKNKLEALPEGEKLSSSAIEGAVSSGISEYDQEGNKLETNAELRIIRYANGTEIAYIVTSTGNQIPI